jgi:hypothetical protein
MSCQVTHRQSMTSSTAGSTRVAVRAQNTGQISFSTVPSAATARYRKCGRTQTGASIVSPSSSWARRRTARLISSCGAKVQGRGPVMHRGLGCAAGRLPVTVEQHHAFLVGGRLISGHEIFIPNDALMMHYRLSVLASNVPYQSKKRAQISTGKERSRAGSSGYCSVARNPSASTSRTSGSSSEVDTNFSMRRTRYRTVFGCTCRRCATAATSPNPSR